MKLYTLLFLLLSISAVSFAQLEVKGYSKYVGGPSKSVISNDGQYYYVDNSKGIGVYKINSTTKLLENIQEISVDGGSSRLVITNDNKFVITTSYKKGMLLIYQRNASNGKLSLHKSYTGSIDGKGTIKEPSDLALSPSGRYLFLASDHILMTLRYENGAVNYLRQHDLEEGRYHRKIHFSPDNKHLFIGNYHYDGVSSRTILTLEEATGVLEPIGSVQEDFKMPTHHVNYFGEKVEHNVFANLDYMAFSPDGKDVYMDGSEVSNRGVRSAFMHYRWVNGQLKFQKAYYDLFGKYKIGSVKNFYLDGSGDYFYALTGGDDSGVFIFKRNKDTGALTFIKSFLKQEGYSKIVTPYRISFSKSNQYIYVSNYSGGNIAIIENKNAKASPNKVDNNDRKPIVSNNTINNSNTVTDNVQVENCPHPSISSTELTKIETQLKALETEQARYDYALKTLQNRCLETLQVLRLARTFEVEYVRLDLVKFAYYYTSDVENFDLLDMLFTSDRLKKTFKELIEK